MSGPAAEEPRSGTAQVGAAQVGNGQAGNGQVGNGQAGNGQVGNGQVGNGQAGNGQAGNGQAGADDLDWEPDVQPAVLESVLAILLFPDGSPAGPGTGWQPTPPGW
jgi:uncharacterized low-complexity protein